MSTIRQFSKFNNIFRGEPKLWSHESKVGVAIHVGMLCAVLVGSLAPIAFAFPEDYVPSDGVRNFINDGDGLRNRNFGQWVGKYPVYWHISPDLEKFVGFNEQNALDGRYALEVHGAYEQFVATSHVSADAPFAGKTVVFTIMARAFRKDSAHAFIEIADTEYSGNVLVRSGLPPRSNVHPGDGRWRTLEASVVFPEDYSGRELRVGFVHEGDGVADTYVFFDRAKLHVYANEEALNRNLIDDPKLTYWRDGVPNSWKLIGGSIAHTEIDGVRSMRLDPADESTPKPAQVDRSLSIYSLDSGKILRVTVDALSEGSGMYYAVYSSVDNKMITLSDRGNSKGGYVPIPASAQWQTTISEHPLPEGLEANSAFLHLELHPRASKPAFVREVKVEIVDE